MKKLILALLLLATAVTPSMAVRLNVGLLHSRANRDAPLRLTEFPQRNMTGPDDQVRIRWEPAVQGVLRFTTNYGGDRPADFPDSVARPLANEAGRIEIRGDMLPVGYLYCIITAANGDYSTVFNIIREAGSAPRMTGPISAAGGEGVRSITPSFSWEPIGGVPYYHLIVSDQPFRIIEEDGRTRVEGANVVWQAITSETSIQYGIPDPSGFFDNDQTPPLVGNLNGERRPRYNWVVLNNYGNNPAYTSVVTGGIAGFEIESRPPFAVPQNVSPSAQATLSPGEILFRWTQVEEATSYFVYVLREEVTAGGSRAFAPAWNGQTTLTSIACPAPNFLVNGHYIWKVLAASQQGHGTISDTTGFVYDLPSARVSVRSTAAGSILEFMQVDVEPVDGPSVPSFSTNDQGEVDRVIPVGTYRFIGSKAGYVDATQQVQVTEGNRSSVRFNLTAISNSIIGTVVDQDGRGIQNASVTAVPIQGGETANTVTNISGQYELLVPAGDYTVDASSDGYEGVAEVSATVQQGAHVDLDAANGPFRLQAYRRVVSGYVRNSAGQPVNTATVTLVGEDGSTTRAYTPEAGTYSFTVGNGVWRLNATKPGFYLEAGEQEVQINGRDAELNFTLVPLAGILSGQVLVDGNPGNRNAEVWYLPSAGDITTTSINQVGGFSRGVAPGDYTLFAVREGYHSTDSLHISVDPGETISGLQLALEANASSISGRVVDGAGNPLRSATISASGVSASTDANGNYRLGISAGGHNLTARKDGYVSAQRGPISVDPGEDVTGIDFRLQGNAGTISGLVRRGNDALVSTTVVAIRQDGARSSVTTDRSGAFRFGLSDGVYTISVDREGIQSNPATYQVQLQAGQTVSDRNFAMRENTGRIFGNVSSAAGAVNTPAITVVQVGNANRRFQTNGNVQGSFTLSVPAGVRYEVTATKQGYSSVTITPNDTLQVGAEIRGDIRLERLPCQITGVVTLGGNAFANAEVAASGANGSFRTTSDRSGRYSLAVAAGQYHMTATQQGYTTAESDLSLGAGQNRDAMNFSISENYATVTGVIRGDNQNGLSGVTVVLFDSVNQRSRNTTTGEGGSFQIDRVIPASYYLIATINGYGRGAQNLGAIIGQQVRRGVTLTLQPRTGRISGIVRDAANRRGISGASVYAQIPGGDRFEAQANDTGFYRITGLPGGRFTVRASKAAYASADTSNFELAAGGDAARDFSLEANDGRITGAVRGPDNAGLRGATVTAQDSLGNYASATSDASGQFTLSGLYRRSAYTISATLARYSGASQRGVAVGGSLTISMTPNNLRAVGRVVNQIVTPVSGTEIFFTSQTDGTTIRATSGQDGRFSAEGLAPNTAYRVQTQRTEANYVNMDTTLQVAQSDVDLADRIHVILRLAAASGSVGLGGVTIEERNLITNRIVIGYSNFDGSYRLTGLRGGDFGDWRIRASKSGCVVTPDSIVRRGVRLNEEVRDLNFTVREVSLNISGSVVDALGAAVDSCAVRALYEGGELTTQTDTLGNYRFSRLLPNTTYHLTTDLPHDAFEDGVATVNLISTDQTGVNLQIDRHSATIFGTVTNPQGAAISGVTVSIPGKNSVTTNNGGVFRISQLGRGSHAFSFTKQGFQTSREIVTFTTGDEVDTLSVQMTPFTHAIFGVVTAHRSAPQRLVPNAVVSLVSTGGTITRNDTSHSDGSYSLADLNLDSTYTITAAKPGFDPEVKTGVRFQGDSVKRVDIAPWEQLRGLYATVRNTDGSPVSDAEIYALSLEGSLTTGSTDRFGEAYLPVRPGLVQVTAASPGNGPISIAKVLSFPSDTAKFVELTLSADAGSLTGRVEGADGSTLQGVATITATSINTNEQVAGFTGLNGDFVLHGLRSGDWLISVAALGYESPEAVRFTLGVGQRASLPQTIKMAKTALILQGIVKDEGGAGLDQARVYLRGASDLDVNTDGTGRWSVANPLVGRYTLSVVANGYASPMDSSFDITDAGIPSITSTAALRLNAISGIVVIDDGTPFDQCRVVLRRGNGSRDTTVTNSYGEYIFLNVGDGTHTVTPSNENYTLRPTSLNAVIANGSPVQHLDFTAHITRGTVHFVGRVTHHGSAEAGAVAKVVNLNSGESWQARTNNNGDFDVTARSPGLFRLSAQIEGAPVVKSPREYGVKGDSTIRDLAVVLPAGRISIGLFDSDRSHPLFGRKIEISGVNIDYTATLYAGANGLDSTLDVLPSGTYQIAPTPVPGLLPPASARIDLAQDQQLHLEWFLGWRVEEPPKIDAGLEDTVRIGVPSVYSIDPTKALLYWQRNDSSLVVQQLVSGGVQGSPGREVRSVEPDYKASSADAVQTFFGVIPPQSRSGQLTYYLQVTTSDNLVFGGPETAREIPISAPLALDDIELSRSQAAMTPRVGVPISLVGFALNDADSNLTASILPPAGHFTWSLANNDHGSLSEGADSASAIYNPTSTGPVTVTLRVEQISTGVVVSKTMTWTNVEPVISSLSLSAGSLMIPSGDSLKFSVTATDTSDALIPIFPQWQVGPAYLADLAPTPFAMDGWLRTKKNVIGRAQIAVRDSVSGAQDRYNDAAPNPSQWGLSIFGEMRNNPLADTLTDGAGFLIGLPAQAVRVGDVAKIHLSRPELPPIMRYTTKHELPAAAYRVQVEGNLAPGVSYTLKFPIDAAFPMEKPIIGVWDPEIVDWVVLEGTFVDDGAAVQVTRDALAGDYAPIGDTKPLGIADLKFSPNPFSPGASPPGLSIEFTLTSNKADRPVLSVNIYNMAGQLVRKLIDFRESTRGKYIRGGENQLIWDGLTDSGAEARNGRYIIVLIASDPSGEVKKVASAVLIK